MSRITKKIETSLIDFFFFEQVLIEKYICFGKLLMIKVSIIAESPIQQLVLHEILALRNRKQQTSTNIHEKTRLL